MTVPITPIDANTNTFGDWLFKTNLVIDAISTKVPSTEDTLVGDVSIDGEFQASNVYTVRIFGGQIGNTGPLEIASNTVFTANVSFASANTVTMDVPSRYVYAGSNTTHFVLAANTATGRGRFVPAAIMGANNTGNINFTGNVTANNLIGNLTGNVIGNLDGDVTSNTVTANTVITNRIETSNTINFVSANTIVYSANTTEINFQTNVVFDTITLEFVDANVSVSNTNLNLDSNSDIVISGLVGTGSVRNEINTLKNEVIAFAIALG